MNVECIHCIYINMTGTPDATMLMKAMDTAILCVAVIVVQSFPIFMKTMDTEACIGMS